jgi:HK97 family phage prohead protease
MMHYRTTGSPGEGMDFVISDGTLDDHGTRINPNGWDLSEFKNNPVALFAHDNRFPIGTWEEVRMERDRLVGRLSLAKKGTSPRIDELIGLIEQGILRAVSVGFKVQKQGDPKRSGFDYEQQLLKEASVVAVGSNPNALMQARSLNISNDTLSLVFGEQAERPAKASNGGHAATPPTKATKMEPLTPQIESAQNSLNAAQDALAAHLALKTDDFAETDKLTGEFEQRKKLLESLKRAERAIGDGAIEARSNGGEQKSCSVTRSSGSVRSCSRKTRLRCLRRATATTRQHRPMCVPLLPVPRQRPQDGRPSWHRLPMPIFSGA